MLHRGRWQQYRFLNEKLRPNGASKIALFIDGDNIQSLALHRALGMLVGYGNVVLQRCYVVDSGRHTSEWLRTSRKYPLQMVEVEDCSEAVDIRMAYDIGSLLEKKIVSTIALMTSDTDFSPVANHIKLMGGVCFAFGDAKNTNSQFKRSVDQFFSLNSFIGSSESQNSTPEEWTPLKPNKRRIITGQSALAAEYIAKADVGSIKAPFRYQEPMDLPPAIFDNVFDGRVPLIKPEISTPVVPVTPKPTVGEIRLQQAAEQYNHFNKVDSFNKPSKQPEIGNPFDKKLKTQTVDDSVDFLKNNNPMF